MNLAEFLKNERDKRCLNQSEMAAKIGVTRCTYNNYEKGWQLKGKIRVPSSAIRKKIAKFTNCSTEYINQLIKNSRKEN